MLAGRLDYREGAGRAGRLRCMGVHPGGVDERQRAVDPRRTARGIGRPLFSLAFNRSLIHFSHIYAHIHSLTHSLTHSPHSHIYALSHLHIFLKLTHTFYLLRTLSLSLHLHSYALYTHYSNTHSNSLHTRTLLTLTLFTLTIHTLFI